VTEFLRVTLEPFASKERKGKWSTRNGKWFNHSVSSFKPGGKTAGFLYMADSVYFSLFSMSHPNQTGSRINFF
jgi:hypothetical protein